jgi:hypothetical protein
MSWRNMLFGADRGLLGPPLHNVRKIPAGAKRRGGVH